MEKKLDIIPLEEWNLFNLFNEKKPLLIAGPCSAESEIQIMETARGLKSIMENLMLDVMYDVPSDKSIEKVVITGDCVKGTEKPLIIRRKTA